MVRNQKKLVPNEKVPGVVKGIKVLQDSAVPASNKFHELGQELTIAFDFDSIQELHKISIHENYLDIVKMYGLKSLAIQTIRMSYFGLKFFGNHIQVSSFTMENTMHLNILPEASVIGSTLEIFKPSNKNDMSDCPVNNKALSSAQMKLSSDQNTRRSSKGNFNFFSNMYHQMKGIGLNQIGKSRMKSETSKEKLLTKDNQRPNSIDIVRRNMIVTIDVGDNWSLLEKVLRYSMQREIPVVVVYNLSLYGRRNRYLQDFLSNKGLLFQCHYANIYDKLNSNLVIFFMAQPDLNFILTRSQRYRPSFAEKNNLIIADIDFNQSRFQIIAINGSKMGAENEQRLYLNLNRLISNRPTLLIVLSPNVRFHTQCADGDLVLELSNQDLLNQLENPDGILIYISREFPEDIRNINVFMGQLTYRRFRGRQAEASIVITSIPLNQ